MTPPQLDDAVEDPPSAATVSNARVAEMSTGEVVEAYAGLVLDTASDLIDSVQSPIDRDDLLGWGYQGLLEAHQRFDPSMDTTFASFAFYRVRGAMYDGLRRTGWAVRGTAIQVRDTLAINDYMESHMLSEHPRKLADSFTDCVNYLDRMIGDCITICLIQNERLELISHSDETTQRQRAERNALGSALKEALEHLSKRERQVLSQYHFEERSMTEIAEAFDMSKSWVSRINARALDKLRQHLFEESDPEELYMIRG